MIVVDEVAVFGRLPQPHFYESSGELAGIVHVCEFSHLAGGDESICQIPARIGQAAYVHPRGQRAGGYHFWMVSELVV